MMLARLRFTLTEVRVPDLSVLERRGLEWVLSFAAAGALVGHGAFGLFMHQTAWYHYFAALGIAPMTVDRLELIPLVGAFEIALGLLLFVRPVPAGLLLAFAWKSGTELLRPLTGEPGFEFVERASNILAPLALIYLRGVPRSLRGWFS